ncbi:MAG: L,D-transpeptidase [Calditrichaeota bacterium]|nr:L,D-transpeptidase [Calditrichota bacterium]
MKRLLWILAIILPLALTGLWFYGRSVAPVIIEANHHLASADTAAFRLPSDPKAAKRELQRAQKALTALRPKGLYVVIDTHANLLYLRTQDSVLMKATCSTGYGGELTDSTTGRKWIFNTPQGVFKINSRVENPWWRKPDWAFIEEGEKPPDDPRERYDSNMLGKYALGFGNGYFIHGTLYTRLLGVAVSHGCVRLGNEDLDFLFKRATYGTPVYII